MSHRFFYCKNVLKFLMGFYQMRIEEYEKNVILIVKKK